MTDVTLAPTLDADTLVSLRDVHVEFPTALGVVHALNGVSFDVPRGKVVGIVGESGCGKSVTSRAIMQLVESPGRITAGEIWYQRDQDGGPAWPSGQSAETGETETIDLATLDPRGSDIRAIRGQEISMIFQEPMTSLNPVYTIGDQIDEAILLHQTPNKKQARERTEDMLRRVGMPNPDRIANSYPHQLSGGMRQRAMIAMALSCAPTLLIADEPTTALDVTTEAQILELMRELQSQYGMSIMFITHSMGVVAQICDEVLVMYMGRVVERASVDDLFYNPKHPYTVSLLRSIPRIGVDRHGRLEVIQGSTPDPYVTLPGCPFHPRCASAIDGLCESVLPGEAPIVERTAGGVHQQADHHRVRCHLYEGCTPTEVKEATHE